MTKPTDLSGLATDSGAVAISEIDEAAALATQSINAFDKTLPKALAPKEDLRDRESRAAFYAKRSLDQKKRGRTELTKTYVGALSMQKKLVVNDVNIASSAERFLGLIDLAIYTFNRRGTPILGAAQNEKILDQIEEMASAYSDKAASAKNLAIELTRVAKEGLLDASDWLEPSYTSSALSAEVHVKSPVTAGLVNAVMDWDKAIHDLSVLHWNGKADAAHYAQLKSEERRELSALFRFAARSLVGLRKASNPPKNQIKRADGLGASDGAQGEQPVSSDLAAAA